MRKCHWRLIRISLTSWWIFFLFFITVWIIKPIRLLFSPALQKSIHFLNFSSFWHIFCEFVVISLRCKSIWSWLIHLKLNLIFLKNLMSINSTNYQKYDGVVNIKYWCEYNCCIAGYDHYSNQWSTELTKKHGKNYSYYWWHCGLIIIFMINIMPK